MLALRRNKTQTNWWELVEQQCEIFFETSGALNTYTSPHEAENLLMVMEDALTKIEQTAYSDGDAIAQHHLVTALSEMLRGFKALLSGEFSNADIYMANAERSLKDFDTAIA